MIGNKIKVLHIIKSLGRGGAEMLLPETLALHNHEKFEFHFIYFLPWKDQMVEAIVQNGGRVSCLSAKNNIQLIAKFSSVKRYIREHKIDIIHAHLPWAGFLSRIVHFQTKIPLIYTEHNKQERYHFLTKLLNNKTFNIQNLAIAVSEDVNSSIKININPSVPVKTILNGVNTAKFNAHDYNKLKLRQELGIPTGAIVFGTVAVFRTQKRLVKWVELAAKIKKELPSAFFVILGDGPVEKEVNIQIEIESIGSSVMLPGRLEEVRPWLATMDIYMMTSEFEGLPIALLEAMSMGLPVVTTDAGGIKEVVRNKQEGYLVNVQNPNELLGPALSMVNDQKSRVEMGAKARERVKNHFSLKRMISELEDTYYDILNN